MWGGASVRPEDRYDSLLRFYGEKHGVPFGLLKRQMLTESGARPEAVSPAGARGLMQFMPATWASWDDDDPLPALNDPHNAEEAIEAAARFMAYLFGRFGEIPDPTERWRFALASYNAGRGHINQALILARESCGQPGPYSAWVQAGRPAGHWQRWAYTARFLPQVTGPHASETLAYVERIAGTQGPPRWEAG